MMTLAWRHDRYANPVTTPATTIAIWTMYAILLLFSTSRSSAPLGLPCR